MPYAVVHLVQLVRKGISENVTSDLYVIRRVFISSSMKITLKQKRSAYIKFSHVRLKKDLFREYENISAASLHYVRYIYKHVFSFGLEKTDWVNCLL